jgi:hypothetical protein
MLCQVHLTEIAMVQYPIWIRTPAQRILTADDSLRHVRAADVAIRALQDALSGSSD